MKISIADNGSRTKYIGKELDTESQLADHGVRKYDHETGRFTSADKLFEKYPSTYFNEAELIKKAEMTLKKLKSEN